VVGPEHLQSGLAQPHFTGCRPESRTHDRRIPHHSPLRPGLEGPLRESALAGARADRYYLELFYGGVAGAWSERNPPRPGGPSHHVSALR
jgi:hypothetical protein